MKKYILIFCVVIFMFIWCSCKQNNKNSIVEADNNGSEITKEELNTDIKDINESSDEEVLESYMETWNKELTLMYSEEELNRIEWDEEIKLYMEYDWIEDSRIERTAIFDTRWVMQLVDLDLDSQAEMIISIHLYNREDITYIYTIENQRVVYCGEIVAGPVNKDNALFSVKNNYFISSYIDVYKNENNEFIYLSGDDLLYQSHGYYQIYKSKFVNNNFLCESLCAINFYRDLDGLTNYEFRLGNWMDESNAIEVDDECFTRFSCFMENELMDYEKINIDYIQSDYYVPGFIDELPEEKREIVKKNIVAGFASALGYID